MKQEIKIDKDFFKDLEYKIKVDVCCLPLREGFAEDCDCAWCNLQRAKEVCNSYVKGGEVFNCICGKCF